MSGKAAEGADPPGDAARILAKGREVLRIEAEGVASLAVRLDERFAHAVRRLYATPGRIVVTGIGKSGLVARKIAATLSSTGTPAFFLHPAEGMHGDVGVLVRGDTLLAVSKSGESAELAELLPAVRRLEIPIIALVGDPESALARGAELALDVGVEVEACPHDLAPTSSSTAAMAVGDALAIALLDLRGFGPDDFARLHPGGRLGRRLLWRVRDVMLSGEDVPRLPPDAPLARAMREIAHRRGTVPVVDAERRVVGVLTAGDLTRFAETDPGFLARPVERAMNRSPRTCGLDDLAAEALAILERGGIMALPVVDPGGRLVGIVHLHDLLRAGVG